MDRRTFLTHGAAVTGEGLAPAELAQTQSAPALITRDAVRPQIPQGVQAGGSASLSSISCG
jgi:alkaline phosphatase D